MEELLKLKDSLPVEGSPHGEAHGQQLRFWLCLGHLMSIESHTVAAAAAAREALQRGALLPATRVVVQNVWAQAVVQGPKRLVLDLVEQLKDTEMPEAFATNSLAVAAQLLLHPDFALSEGNELEQLWSATIAWSASYVHQPRLLASLVLFHALEEQRIRTPGWYLEALHQQVRDASAFKKLRSKVKIEDWISDCWREVLKPTRPLDVQLAKACKQVAGDFWSPPDEDADEHVSGSHQRRPERPGNDQGDVVDIVVCASLVDNVPNMAGLVRTSEALLGRRVEVALRNEKVLQEASFQKMVVAADKSVRLSSVPCGPRLLAFLREHRSAGREVIALEQTSSSEMLQAELRLPQRFVLLLGSEQEGLPAWLLQSGLVDRCIELPLRGQTGSLNVHVAAAMLLWHYRLQH
ncbi:unnamed protein product [Durusdinium trenchii]|uniref:tRNA/rRNA methyltransferase SpoU type domain-containing protein n=1 Tax=Durusdinium trenchii TaxID=1381693 RepID=A0ABP0SF75_9DINO